MLELGSWGHSVLQTPALVFFCLSHLLYKPEDFERISDHFFMKIKQEEEQSKLFCNHCKVKQLYISDHPCTAKLVTSVKLFLQISVYVSLWNFFFSWTVLIKKKKSWYFKSNFENLIQKKKWIKKPQKADYLFTQCY